MNAGLDETLAAIPGFAEAERKALPAKAVALAMAQLRADHDLTQAQLAHRFGTTEAVIALIESGKLPEPLGTWEARRARWMSDPEYAAAFYAEYPDHDMAIAIVAGRSRRGLTQQDFALLLGISVATVERLESGNLIPPGYCEACPHRWNRHSRGGMCDGDGTECYCVLIPEAV